MHKFELGFTFITKEATMTRDGIVLKGARAEVVEISEDEHNADGEAEPYKLLFDRTVEQHGETINISDWFTEEDIVSLL